MQSPEQIELLARGRAVIATLPSSERELADVVWHQHCLGIEIELIVRTTRRPTERVSRLLTSVQDSLAGQVRGTLVSVGYEGRNLAEFIDLILEHAVTTVVDVRLTPLSRKKGFSKRALAEALSNAGVGYVHESELGNPKDNRQPFQSGNLDEGRARFFSILDERHAVLDRVIRLLDTARVALLCFEREHEQCHRSCIIERIEDQVPDVELVFA